MKKIVITIACILLTLSAVAESFLSFRAEFVPSYEEAIPNFNPVRLDKRYGLKPNMLECKFEIRKDLFNFLFIGGTADIYTLVPEDIFTCNYQPISLASTLEFGIFYKNLQISFWHRCTHPVDCWNVYGDYGTESSTIYQLVDDPIYNLNQALDKIILQYKISL